MYNLIKVGTGVDDERNPTSVVYGAYGVISDEYLSYIRDIEPVVIEQNESPEVLAQKLVDIVTRSATVKWADETLCSPGMMELIIERMPEKYWQKSSVLTHMGRPVSEMK